MAAVANPPSQAAGAQAPAVPLRPTGPPPPAWSPPRPRDRARCCRSAPSGGADRRPDPTPSSRWHTPGEDGTCAAMLGACSRRRRGVRSRSRPAERDRGRRRALPRPWPLPRVPPAVPHIRPAPSTPARPWPPDSSLPPWPCRPRGRGKDFRGRGPGRTRKGCARPYLSTDCSFSSSFFWRSMTARMIFRSSSVRWLRSGISGCGAGGG